MTTTFPFEFPATFPDGDAPYGRAQKPLITYPWFAPEIATSGVPDALIEPRETYRYLEHRRQVILDAPRQRPLIRLWDKNMLPLGRIAQEKSMSVEELMADSGAGSVVIRRDNWLSNFILHDRRIEEDVHITVDIAPTQPDIWQTRWGGKVTGIDAHRDSKGIHTVEMELVHNREHWKHLLAGANPVTPPEFQLPKEFILPWNCRTNLTITGFINLARQFFPLLSIPDNILNPGGWIGCGLKGFDPRQWPLQMQFVDPLTDQSRFEIFSARWTDMHTAGQPILEDAGCMVRAYTWLLGDKTSPHPELDIKIPGLSIIEDLLAGAFPWVDIPTSGNIADLVRPQRNAVIFAVEDKSGVTGPTGTFADGFVNAIAATADNMITDTILVDVVGQQDDGTTNPLFRKWFMVAPAPAWAVYRDGEYSGIVDSHRIQHGATAKTQMVGSHSPQWLNQLQTFGIRYALSELSALFYAPGGLSVSGFQAPGTPGLSDIYQGQLDDTLFAWQRWTDPVRALRMGDFGFLEHFAQGVGSAWTVSGVLGLRDSDWKTRAYNSFQVTVRNGSPYLVGVDFDLGDRVAFEIGGVFHTDQVSAIKRSYDETTPLLVELSIGNTVQEQDPVAMATRTIAAVWNMFGSFMGSTDVF